MTEQTDQCTTCKGHGFYIQRETYTDGDTADVAFECNDCNGTGITGGRGGDFDIEGGEDDEA